MKISSLHLEQFMRIECVSMEFPESGAITIGAANGGGKTSLKTFLEAAFGGKDKCPTVPVKIGAKKALGKLTLDDDGRCVTIEVEIGTDRELKATVRQDGGPAFKGPMSMLKALVSGFSFDPFKVMRLTGREQRDTLLQCLGVDFADLEGKADEIKEERKQAGRDVAGREKQIASMPEYAGVPSNEIRTAEVVAELQAAMRHNERVRKFAEAVGEWEGAVEESVENIAELKKQLAKQESDLAHAREMLAQTTAQAALLSPIDTAPHQAKITNAEAINAKVRANKARTDLVDQFRQDHERYAELGEALKAIDRQKQDRLAAAKAPVEGLEFRDDGVYFQGLPLSQEAGSGQMIRAVELTAALNPRLRTIVIDDGERIMLPRLAELDRWATEHDYQVFVLRASEGAECKFVIEEGKSRP